MEYFLRKFANLRTFNAVRNIRRFYCTGPAVNSFCQRTHHCGELNKTHIGTRVQLCGWLQYQRMGYFLTLRDSHGVTQVTVPQDRNPEFKDMLSKLSFESVLLVEGVVQARPEGQENKNMPTGEIEVIAENLDILNNCRPDLPFQIHEHSKVRESLRMEYRYLDLRNAEMQQNLRLRSKVIMKMREFLCTKHGFVDVETPTLFKRTPGGAREFVVPTHQLGKFYTLPQSPQQFKQLLMVGGIDRYMQIARCYRDETTQPDRQPEFTQIDIEMSFVTAEDIKALIEQMLQYAWPEDRKPLTLPFPKIPYDQAIKEYGSDKPDTRFDMKLEDVSHIMKTCGIPRLAEAARQAPEHTVQALNFKQAGKHLTNKNLEDLRSQAKQLGPDVLSILVRVNPDGRWPNNLATNLGVDVHQRLVNELKTQAGDLVMMTAGQYTNACKVLGRLRVETANLMERKGELVRGDDEMNFLWVEDFPLFLPKDDGTEGLESAHHPFTAPQPDDTDLLYIDPEKARGLHFDLVLNGNEIGGGSIRVHDSKLQHHILQNVLKEDSSPLGHLLAALDCGCPPHGGIALGLDRLMALLVGAQTIRDVIAFPKGAEGQDLMAKAPGPITVEDRIYYHLPHTSKTDFFF